MPPLHHSYQIFTKRNDQNLNGTSNENILIVKTIIFTVRISLFKLFTSYRFSEV